MTTSPPTVAGTANIGNSPLEIRLNAAGTRAYVQAAQSVSPFSPLIAVVDLTTSPPSLVTQWAFSPNPSWSINDFGLSADGSKLYVSRGTDSLTAGGAGAFISENGTFQVLDTTSGAVLEEVPTGHLATSMAKDASDSVFVTTDVWTDSVSIISAPPPACYANCDASTTAPVLNVADFTCFLQKYAAGDPYGNCDASTTAPVLNVADFTCFLQKYAAGCP
jgi:DNA-binding beta-propeller fold protein YncE